MALAGGSCSLRTLAVTDATGCSLTRASISAMTPTAIEALANQELGVAMALKQATEAKIAGYRENTLETLLRSNIRPIKQFMQKAQIPTNGSVIQPFFYRPQKRHINTNYWKVTAGAAAPGAGSGGAHAGLRRLTITNPGGTYSSAVTNPERYFVPGMYINVDHANAGTKAAYRANFKVVASSAATSTSCYVDVEPNVTSATFAAYSAGAKAPWEPSVGLVIILPNSVSAYESWCYNLPSENPRDLLVFWPQSSRHTFQYTDAYVEALNALLNSSQTNIFSAQYSTFLPIAQQNMQQHKQFMSAVMQAAFYGQQIDETQTADTYASLPGVFDPANPSCLLEYKANALGFMTQLGACSRVVDNAGAALNLNTLFDTGYDLKRAREATAGNVDRIEFMTDRWTYGLIQEALHKYFQTRYNVSSTKFIEENQKLMDGTEVLANYATYQLPADDGGYELCFITHPYFDDKVVSAASGDTRNRVRTLWGLDWSDVALGVGDVINKTRETNIYDNLYNCTVKQNITHYQLRHLQFCPMIEDPLRHSVYDNFTEACPSITTTGCTVTTPE